MSKPGSVVVLGGTGFVGRHLCARLRQAGWQVTVLSRNGHQGRNVTVSPGVRLRTVDVYADGVLAEAFAGADAVINLVGILNESGFGGKGFARAHVELTKKVIDACAKAGVRRLLQMSALNAGRGRSHYLRSRGEAEQCIEASELDWTMFQSSVIFGPQDGLFYRFANLLRYLPVIPLACADTKFAPVYVGDVAAAIVNALGSERSIGQRYELYGDRVMTLREIVAYTATQCGWKRWIVPLPDYAGRLQALACDFVPGKPFSTDNFLSLQHDSVGGIDGLFQLGIKKTSVDAVVPRLLGACGREAELDQARARLR